MAFDVETTDRVEVRDVTDRVAAAIPEETAGTCTVFVPHTTAGVTINENESGLLADVEAALERLVPRGEGYEHDRIDDNADAHLRAMLVGSDATIPVRDGDLALGTWQRVLFVECDGPRTRQVVVSTPGSDHPDS